VKARTLVYVGNLLMLIWLVLGVWVVFSSNVLMGVLYIVVISLSLIIVAYSLCTKCPCRFQSCAHIVLGRLTELLPRRKPGRYMFWDRVGSVAYLVGLHALPQYWLWQNKVVFALFWVLSAIVFLVLRFAACPMCKNEYCPLKGTQTLGIGRGK
jgi:hypothetical protein